MRNKPVFSLSPAIIKENFKMFWYLPALSFIAYFLATEVYAIHNYIGMGLLTALTGALVILNRRRIK